MDWRQKYRQFWTDGRETTGREMDVQTDGGGQDRRITDDFPRQLWGSLSPFPLRINRARIHPLSLGATLTTQTLNKTLISYTQVRVLVALTNLDWPPSPLSSQKNFCPTRSLRYNRDWWKSDNSSVWVKGKSKTRSIPVTLDVERRFRRSYRSSSYYTVRRHMRLPMNNTLLRTQ